MRAIRTAPAGAPAIGLPVATTARFRSDPLATARLQYDWDLAAIKLILDNHSAHISKETNAWLADQPAGRFEFTFTPKHGSWLNLVEGFFSKLARSVLRHIRVASKQELKDRIMAAMDEFNRHPVVHTWSYKIDQAA